MHEMLLVAGCGCLRSQHASARLDFGSFTASSIELLRFVYPRLPATFQGMSNETNPLCLRMGRTLGAILATSLNILAGLLMYSCPRASHRFGLSVGIVAPQGKFGEAGPLYKRSLDIYEKTYGPDHPDVASSLNNLASLLQDQVRAIRQFRKFYVVPDGDGAQLWVVSAELLRVVQDVVETLFPVSYTHLTLPTILLV